MKVFQSLSYEGILKALVHCSDNPALYTKDQFLLCRSTDCGTRTSVPASCDPLPEPSLPNISVTATWVHFSTVRKEAGCLIAKSLILD